METKIYKIDEENMDLNLIKEAADLIKKGELVSFPTETVYGLGADGLNPKAVRKIFEAKGRPSDNPLILHISKNEELNSLVSDLGEEEKKVMEEFWPGPITIIFKKSNLIPDEITAGLDTVAIRMPDNEIARSLIEYSGSPIAAPSANTSGKPSPTRADHVYFDLKGKLELILDGGSTSVGLESTVLDLSEDIPMILRPGAVTLEDLRKVLPRVEVDPSIISLSQKERPKSPGQKYKHYAPNSEMIVFEGEMEAVVAEINRRIAQEEKEGKKVGVLATDETRDKYKTGKVYSMGSRDSLISISQSLFDLLRLMDQEEVDIILSESVGYTELGMAIMNRMLKASGGKLVKL